MRTLLSLALSLLIGCACMAQDYVKAGEQNGVTLSYAWSHKKGKPSALLLKIANPTDEKRQVHVDIDLAFEGLTVEQFAADTLIGAHRTFTGKLNGIYFVPTTLTPEQAASADTHVEVTRFTAAPVPTE
ncbi:MAG TPA: hypothetical protein VHL57_06120 [Flavobacteriales bacterium]|jgi:hypothetical protein|nr:hypothetical protein [Flavobacteriales bacterium]